MKSIKLTLTVGCIIYLTSSPALASSPLGKSTEEDEYVIIDSPSSEALSTLKEKSENSYSYTIIQLLNKLDTIARTKNQNFEEGTYVVEDPTGSLFNLLKDFNDQDKKTYERISSHFPERCPEVKSWLGYTIGTQGYGIDISLSGNKHHLLFNKFTLKNKKYVFIKPETHGTQNWGDFAAHALDYGASLYRKITNPEANESATMRKEHTPVKVKQAWQNLIKNSSLPEKLQKEGEKHGIYRMLDLIQENQASLSNQALLKAFNDTLIGYDHLNIRKGNEVIISAEEFNQAQVQPMAQATSAGSASACAQADIKMAQAAAPTVCHGKQLVEPISINTEDLMRNIRALLSHFSARDAALAQKIITSNMSLEEEKSVIKQRHKNIATTLQTLRTLIVHIKNEIIVKNATSDIQKIQARLDSVPLANITNLRESFDASDSLRQISSNLNKMIRDLRATLEKERLPNR